MNIELLGRQAIDIIKSKWTLPETGFLARHFKPLHKDVLPKAPNSVFDLSNFMQQRAS